MSNGEILVTSIMLGLAIGCAISYVRDILRNREDHLDD